MPAHCKDVPVPLRMLLFAYSFPLTTITMAISRHDACPLYFLLSIALVPLVLLPVTHRTKLLVLTVMHMVAVAVRSVIAMYALYGLLMAVCYNAVLQTCLCCQSSSVVFAFRMEMIGHLLGIFLPYHLHVVMLILQLVILVRTDHVPLEISGQDRKLFLPQIYHRMSRLYKENYVLLSSEYKMIVEVFYRRQHVRPLFLVTWLCHLPLCFPMLPRIIMAIGPLIPVYKNTLLVFVALALLLIDIEVCAVVAWFVKWIDDTYDGPYGYVTVNVCARLAVFFIVYSIYYGDWIERLLVLLY